MEEITIEIHHRGLWHQAARYRRDRSLAYDIDYVVQFMDENHPMARVGLGFTINFEEYSRNGWPAFLFDIIPGGAARAAWFRRHGQLDSEDAASDWTLLCYAASCSPGNLRIASAVERWEPSGHPGFTRNEIIDRNIGFIDYAEASGAIVAGASSVQGQAPKFLLVEDWNGRWHAEGALPDEKIKKHWLVKFPRGRTDADRLVLRNEAPYYEVARNFGLKVGAPLIYESDALFIERFDRTVQNGKVVRYGLESATSICGQSASGPGIGNDQICHAMARLLEYPQPDIIEFLRRDILNLALGNVDNHGRNTAYLKTPQTTALSPLFDFAPMFLDPEGIPRAARWKAETPMNLPDWGAVAESIQCRGLAAGEIRAMLRGEVEGVEKLPDTMQQCGVDFTIIERLTKRIADLVLSLKAL
ncbi:MAG: HipA domain-containing protein [Desulfuromonadaceae bacterium]|nr:HipA domain-containing protein [Desulfuromonadaceae bacterium]